PEGPSKHTSRPCSMVSETSSTTATSPYRLVTPRSSTDATPILLDARRALSPPSSRLLKHQTLDWYPRQLAATPSGTGKCRLALLHEGAPPFDEDVAGEALVDQLWSSRHYVLGCVLHDLAAIL